MTSTTPGSDATERTGHRERLLAAVRDLVAERPLTAVTVADVVRAAGCSRRTFYEHFDDREHAFLAMYVELGDVSLGAVRDAMSGDGSRHERLEAGVRALVASIAGRGLSRTYLVEVFALGERGLAARRRLLEGYAASFREVLVERADGPLLSEAHAAAVVAGVMELVLRRVERGDPVTADDEELVAEITGFLEPLAG